MIHQATSSAFFAMFQATASKRLISLGWLSEWQWEDRLPRMVDACLWSLVVLAPFAWGGRHDAARYLYALLAVGACAAWIAQTWIRSDMRWTLTPTLLIPLLAAGWLALQITPLPPAAIDWLSPRSAELLPLWNSANATKLLGQSGWSTLSMNPQATQTALAMLLSYALVFFVALQRLKTIADVVLLLRWLGIAAAAMALFGLLQFWTADGLFFWVYEHPYRRSDHFVCGSFINRNHFASFLALGAAAIAFRLVQEKPEINESRPRRSGRRRPVAASRLVFLWTVLLAVVLLAILMSFSRGATVATAAGATILSILYWRGKLWGAKQVGCLLMTVVFLGIGLALYTDERLTARLGNLTAGSIEELDRFGGRRMIWNANLHAIADGWRTGSGAGTHRDIYPVYFTDSWPKVFTHAESGYLQIATETGLPGVLLLSATFITAIVWSVRASKRCKSREAIACLGAILAAITVSAMHSLVDFVWYIPATMTVVVLLLAALCQLANMEYPEERAKASLLSRHGRRDLTLAFGGIAAFVLYVLSGPAIAARSWDQYDAHAASHELFQESAYEDLLVTGDPNCLGRGGSHLQAKAQSLRKVVEANPHSARAHRRLAEAYLQGFDARAEERDNRMGLAHLQATVASGGFSSSEEIYQWLRRAIGEDFDLLLAARHHALCAARLSPLDGRAYVCLANLSFLNDPTGGAAKSYYNQAVSVRPHQGDVLFEVGKHHLVVGDIETAIDFWQRCYRLEGHHRLLVVNALAGRIPADDFLATFQPDWKTLRAVWQRYLATGEEQDIEAVLAYAETITTDYEASPGKPAAAYVWQWLAMMHGETGDATQELKYLERAVADNGSIYTIRQAFGLALLRSERFAESESHLRWCLARHPENKGMRIALQQASSGRVKNRSSATASRESYLSPSR